MRATIKAIVVGSLTFSSVPAQQSSEIDFVRGQPVVKTEWSYAYPSNLSPREHPLTLQVQNERGAIRIVVRPTTELEVKAASSKLIAISEDVEIARVDNVIQVAVRAVDDSPIDLDIAVPYGVFVEAATTTGLINYNGFGKVDLQTDTGAVTVTAPWNATRFELLSAHPPGEFTGNAKLQKTNKFWVARDRLSEELLTYGEVSLKAQRPERIRLVKMGGIPENSAVKMHWQAPDILRKLFRNSSNRLRSRRPRAEPPANKSVAADFSADARLVQLEVAVTGSDGQPIVGLGTGDFEVIENGHPQPIIDVSSTNKPFNLVLLLDGSSSTEGDRPDIEEAARRFIGVARPTDKVAVYALADTMFQALSTLTVDHASAGQSAGLIATFGGATPLYDIIVLTYAHELASLPRERNAIVVLSDGIDNALYKWGSGAGFRKTPDRTAARLKEVTVPSNVSFEDLRSAAREMDAMIYPVLLDPAISTARTNPAVYENARRWSLTARDQAQQLAKASGGRVFQARSVRDLSAVYEQVAQELRSIYTLSYRPTDQRFNGKWRGVRVRTKKAKASVRTRPGYYAY